MTLHKFLAQLEAAGHYTPPAGHGAGGGNGTPPGPPPTPGDPAASRYAHAALIAESHRVAGQQEGVRNHELVRSAYRMGQLIGAGYLDRLDAYDELLRAALASGLGAAEARATILSGLNAGIAAPRAVTLHTPIPEPYVVTLGAADTANQDGGAGVGGHLSPPVPTQVSGGPQDQPGDSPGQGVDDGLPVPLDWHAVWDSVTVEPDWLVPDILERGRSHVLYAPHKIGKSLLTLSLCGQLVRDGVHVLYVDLENSLADIVGRLRDMGHQPGDLDTLHYLSFPQMAALDSPLGGATLLALVEKHQAQLVVLDTTARVITGEENDADTFRALYRHALVPLKALAVTVLRLDHAGKNPLAGQRGSSAKGDDVDTVWLLLRHDDARYQLKCDAQRSGHHPQFVDLIKHEQPLRFEPTRDPFGQPEVTVILDHLERLGVPPDAGREVARRALTTAGIRVQNSVLAEAVKINKSSITRSKYLSGTGASEVDHENSDYQCPKDQLPFSVSPAQTCPGQVGDSGDSGGRVPLSRPVPTPVRLKGGQVGTVGLDLSGTPTPECDRCHQSIEQVFASPYGRFRRLCVECAYPDPSTRPGVTQEESE